MTLADKPRTDPTEALTKFRWEPQPKAAAFVQEVVTYFLARLPAGAAFADRLHKEAGVRFIDMVDAIEVAPESDWIAPARDAGWRSAGPVHQIEIRQGEDQKLQSTITYIGYSQPHGIFPPLLCYNSKLDARGIDIILKVDSVVDFMTAHGIAKFPPFDGVDLFPSRYRECKVFASTDGNFSLSVAERIGVTAIRGTFMAGRSKEDYGTRMIRTLDAFRTRPRSDRLEGWGDFLRLGQILDEAINYVGRDVACHLFFAAEREYWQRRNRAAQVQKARQDRLGIGWANHDHHTYRSSRRHFHRLVALWEKLGFECRERFYPGIEAGWGAQVMEQPVCGIVTFNDVDISPDELKTDFAHEPMTERNSLGTVGLWCALHGESVLGAGMHHLECTFDFDALREQMQREVGIDMMKPFSDFPWLKQQFTQGERWDVEPQRIDRLVSQGLIGREQAEEFRRNGAIGSHLENLERNDGFKGFNQTGVTEIIHATDPRRQ